MKNSKKTVLDIFVSYTYLFQYIFIVNLQFNYSLIIAIIIAEIVFLSFSEQSFKIDEKLILDSKSSLTELALTFKALLDKR